jgi:hypothetical protein
MEDATLVISKASPAKTCATNEVVGSHELALVQMNKHNLMLS